MRKTMLAAAIALALFVMDDTLADAPPKEAMSNSFMRLTPEQRYWWIHGAVTTTAHMIAVRDRVKGDCAATWFLNDRATKQKLIEETILKYPDDGPTTIVISLLTQACGELVPPDD